MSSTRTAPVWRAGAVASVAAAAATALVAIGARSVDVPMRAGNIGAHTAQKIGPVGFALPALVCSAIGTVLAVLLARRAIAARAAGTAGTGVARRFLVTTLALTTVSFVSPLLAGATAAATKATLVVAHIVAAGIVIPALTRSLSEVARSAAPVSVGY